MGDKIPGVTYMIPAVLNRALSIVTGETISPNSPGELNAGSDDPKITASSVPDGSGRMSMTIAILLVDDEFSLLHVGRIYLERTPGISVTIADSGASVLWELETRTFYAIVSDYQMPEMDGITFLQEVRSRSRTLPFILFTGRGREDVVIKALNYGADYHLQKGGDPKSQYA